MCCILLRGWEESHSRSQRKIEARRKSLTQAYWHFASTFVNTCLSYYLIGECGCANDLWLDTKVATQLSLAIRRCEARQVQRHFALLIIKTLFWIPKKSTYIEYLWYVSASLTYSRHHLSVDWFETSSDCLLILLVAYLERPVQIICSCGLLWFLAHQIRRSKMAPLSFCSPSTSHTPISHPPWNF